MFFDFFKILISWVHRRVKGQKALQNDKKFCLSHSISQEPYIMWFYGANVWNGNISRCFFFNFEILIFWFVRGLKGQKISQNGRSFCQSHLIFQNHISYDLHLWYTCMYQRLISPGILKKIFFKFLIFGIIRGGRRGEGKRAKNDPKCQKNSVSLTPYLRNHTSYSCNFWYTCKMMNLQQIF